MFAVSNTSQDAAERLVPLAPKDYYGAAYDLRDIAQELEQLATSGTDPNLACMAEDMAARLRNALEVLETGWRKRKADLRVVK